MIAITGSMITGGLIAFPDRRVKTDIDETLGIARIAVEPVGNVFISRLAGQSRQPHDPDRCRRAAQRARGRQSLLFARGVGVLKDNNVAALERRDINVGPLAGRDGGGAGTASRPCRPMYATMWARRSANIWPAT